VFMNVGCAKKAEVNHISVSDIPLFQQLDLTEKELSYLQKLSDSGTLSIASQNGKSAGYHYDLIKHFADNLNVELTVTVVDMKQYYKIDGEDPDKKSGSKTKKNEPDLFEDVIIYCNAIIPEPWNEQLVSFVPFLQIKEVIVYRNDVHIVNLEELDNRFISVQTGSSHVDTLKSIEKKNDFSLNYIYTDNEEDALKFVSTGKAEATILNSDSALLKVRNYDNLSIGVSVSEMQKKGWAVKKSSYLLASILEKYIDYTMKSGMFDVYWSKDYDLSFNSYLLRFNLDKFEEHGNTLIEILNLSHEETEYINNVINRGYINVAFSSDNYGYNYNLIKYFTEELGIDLQKKIVNLEDYFAKEGYLLSDVVTDPSISYTPDLFNEVDLYCDSLTVLPWREKLLKYVPLIDVMELVVSRSENVSKSITDLNGKRIAIEKGSSYDTTMKMLEKEHGLTVEYVYTLTQSESIEAVASGEVYAVILDSNLAIGEVNTSDSLVINLGVSNIAPVGWAVQKDNVLFASILSKYIRYSKVSDLFNVFWFEEYGFTYFEYVEVLNILE